MENSLEILLKYQHFQDALFKDDLNKAHLEYKAILDKIGSVEKIENSLQAKLLVMVFFGGLTLEQEMVKSEERSRLRSEDNIISKEKNKEDGC